MNEKGLNHFAERMADWGLFKVDDKLRESVKQKIDAVLNSTTFHRPVDLANAYLGREKAFPLPVRWAFEVEMKKMLKRMPSSGAITPHALKPIEDEFWQNWNGELEVMKGKIDEGTLAELEKNNDKKTIKKILEALFDFKPFIAVDSSARRVVNEKPKEAFTYFKKKHSNVIKATEFLLKGASLSDREKEVVKGIQARHQFQLERLKHYREVTLDPIKEELLNRGVTPSLLTQSNPEGWITEYYQQCHKEIVYKKPAGRPKKIIFHALVIVICKLLEDDRKQVKWLYDITSEIVNQCLGLQGNERLTAKKIDNILHSA